MPTYHTTVHDLSAYTVIIVVPDRVCIVCSLIHQRCTYTGQFQWHRNCGVVHPEGVWRLSQLLGTEGIRMLSMYFRSLWWPSWRKNGNSQVLMSCAVVPIFESWLFQCDTGCIRTCVEHSKTYSSTNGVQSTFATVILNTLAFHLGLLFRTFRQKREASCIEWLLSQTYQLESTVGNHL